MRFIATKLVLGSMVLLQAGCEYEPKMHMDIPGMHPLKIQLLGSHDYPSEEVLGEIVERDDLYTQHLSTAAGLNYKASPNGTPIRDQLIGHLQALK